jgi:hypothetical protein
MSKIFNVRLPNAVPSEYSPQQFNQLVRSLEQIILQLNSTYTSTIDQDTLAASSWFGDSGAATFVSPAGVGKILVPFGSFSDDTDQLDGSTTDAYPVRLNTTYFGCGGAGGRLCGGVYRGNHNHDTHGHGRYQWHDLPGHGALGKWRDPWNTDHGLWHGDRGHWNIHRECLSDGIEHDDYGGFALEDRS